MESLGRTVRIVGCFVTALVCCCQLFLCVLDRILHTQFILSVFALAVFVCNYLYGERGYTKWRDRAIAAAVLWAVTILFFALWSLKTFESIEMFSAGVAYVRVKGFGRDVCCFSNGRESEITASMPYDLYLVDGTDSEEAVTQYFLTQYPDLQPVTFDSGDVLAFHAADPDALMLVAERRPHRGYDVWKVAAERAYRYKNIWGDVSRYQNPGIHPR